MNSLMMMMTINFVVCMENKFFRCFGWRLTSGGGMVVLILMFY